MIDLRALANGFVTRSQRLSLTGGRRDLECRAYYEGAAAALDLAGLEADAKVVRDQAALIIGPRGFAGAVHLACATRSVFFNRKGPDA